MKRLLFFLPILFFISFSNAQSNLVIFSKDFEDQNITSGGWTSHNVTGAETWVVPSTQFGHNNSYCGYMNGYNNGPRENENWLISPAFSPGDYDNINLSFWNTSAYGGPTLQLFWSDNFSGDPTTATWTEITNVQWHDGITYWLWTFSEVIDLSHLTGTNVHIGFKYTSTNQAAAAWEIDDIILKSVSTEGNNKAKKLISSIAIDGHLEEEFWDISNGVTINNGSDNSANFGLIWDENYLYIGVAVTDNILGNGRRQAFYDDGVEICIDGNHDQSTGFDENDLQLAKPINSFWVQEMNKNFDGILHKYKETSDGYTMEFAIPWTTINTTPEAGNFIGFNLIVNDDDDAANPYNLPSQLIWDGSSNYHQSPQNWGSIQLSSETIGFSDSYLALLSHNEGEFLINGRNTDIKWLSHGVNNVKIEYSTDNGNLWTVITESTNAASGIYQWSTNATASEEVLFRISDASNSSITDVSDEASIISQPFASSELLIPSIWHNYMWPYNAYYPEDENGINGHMGNGCGPSALARIIHAWKFPRQGSGSLNFTDNFGTVWSADFENTIYNYDNMPDYLSQNASEPEYTDVARLFLHTMVSMKDLYGTGTDLPNMSNAMSTFFNYKESEIAYMHDYTPAQWTQLLKNEIDNGRSLLIQAMNLDYFGNWHTSNGIGGHWYHCDGYNENGEFHIVVGFGNYQYDGYYSIEEFPIYSYNIGVLTGLEPDLDGKSLSITQPLGGESVTVGEQLEITWESSGISNLKIEYTLDKGLNWIEIESAADAETKSLLWTAPESFSDQCKIRLTDTEDINVYDQSKAPFTIIDTQLAISSPVGGESFVFGNTALIKWDVTPVTDIDIKYSIDNGNSWITLVTNFDASQMQYEWSVPQSATNQGLIKIADSNNESNFSTSGTFSIVPQNLVGGPYTSDENTLLLWHAEGNLYNQSNLTGEIISSNGTTSYSDNTLADLGKVAYINNNILTVPQTGNLNLTGDWTIELWFKPETFNPGLQYLIWKPGDNDEYFSNYALQISEYWGNQLYGFYFSGENRIGVNPNFVPATNQWYHVAFVRNSVNSSLSLIVRNAQREIINTFSINDNGIMPLTSSQDLKIGFNFNGYIDEVRISDIVRTFEPESGFTISAGVNPANSGTINGTGNYEEGETATLTATPQNGYNFVNWTENGIEVSTNPEYSFAVNENRTLVANFVSQMQFGTDNSFELITWNIEFFPLNDQITIDYLSSMIQGLDADIIAFQEVADVDAFNQMIDNIDGYNAFVGTTDNLIKLALAYKTDVIQANSIYEIYTENEYYLPFLRRPLVMECHYEGEKFVIINNHFKARGDGILDLNNPNDEENRRWVASNLIKDYVDDNFPNDNVIVVGDLNDVITDDYENNVFQSIIDDPENYAFADYEIAIGPSSGWSYPDYPSHIDHIIITNELYDEFYAHSSSINTLKIEDYLAGGWNEYTQNISDHRPVAIKLFPSDEIVFNKDFEDQNLTSGGWTSHNITGAQIWSVPENQFGHNNSYCAKISGYDNGALENENWLISPVFSPDEHDNLYLSFWNTSAYNGPGLQLFWSNNFNGDPTTANWNEISNVHWHDGVTNWVWTFSEIIDLSYLTGTSVHIAFKYSSTTQEAATWELDDIKLSEAENLYTISVAANPSSGGTVSGAGVYQYGETVTLTANPEVNYSFLNWTENGDVVSTNVNYTFSVSQHRSLTATFSIQTDITYENNKDLTISPNPASDYIRINNRQNAEVNILSLTGVCVASYKIIAPDTPVDISALSGGIYLVEIKTADNSTCKKLVINK
jgi:hypothetical protein